MDDLYTLEELSRRLGNIPISTLKHRIQQLGIPAAARGARNKLLFEPSAIEVLEAADRLIRDGRGIQSVRQVLKIAEPAEGGDEALEAWGEASASATATGPLDRLSRSLESALEQLANKDRQLEQLQEELRRATEAAATFQQKTFYLQGELQRLQGELRDARAAALPPELPPAGQGGLKIGPLPWRLWKRET